MKKAGAVLLAFGAVIVVIAFLLPTTVSSPSLISGEFGQIVNLSRLQGQTLTFATGAVLFLSGTIFTAAGAILERLPAPDDAAPSDEKGTILILLGVILLVMILAAVVTHL